PSTTALSAVLPPFSREITLYVPSSSFNALSWAKITPANAATISTPAIAKRFMGTLSVIRVGVILGGTPDVVYGRGLPTGTDPATRSGRIHLSFFFMVRIIDLPPFSVLNSLGRSSSLALSTAQIVRVSPSSL